MSNPQDDIFRALDMLVGAGTKIVASENAKATALAAQNLSATMQEKKWEREDMLLENKRQYDLSVDNTQNLIRDVDYLEKEIYKLGLSQEYQDALPKEFKTVEFDNTLNAISQENRKNLEGSYAAINENMTSMEINKANAYNNSVKLKHLNRLANEYQQGSEMYSKVADIAGVSGLRDLSDVETFIESQSKTMQTELSSAQKKGLRAKDSEHWKNNITKVTGDDRITFIDHTTGNKGEVLLNPNETQLESALNEASRNANSNQLYMSLESTSNMIKNTELKNLRGIDKLFESGLQGNLDGFVNPGRKGAYTKQEIQEINGIIKIALENFKLGLDNDVLDGVPLHNMNPAKLYNTFYDQEELYKKGGSVNIYGLKDAQINELDWKFFGDDAKSSQKIMFYNLLNSYRLSEIMLGNNPNQVSESDEKVNTKTIEKQIEGKKKDKALETQTVDDPWLEDYSNPDNFKL
ncbi:MAG: hypothetical protein Unbinned3849contig1000_4 [Prokaryotic dsDNA virus sp.]|nr:MAG: hypothetical protein Unbinned3849contig1000_4 [Prokaryotic dsDNA virus sp.]|tara:strand:- start:45584 stop:46978 length:1395 start_codon:yes stop_codon:yes gene_type:complete